MKGELGEKGSCPVVYLGGALAPWVRTPRPELDRRASIHPYRFLSCVPAHRPQFEDSFGPTRKVSPPPHWTPLDATCDGPCSCGFPNLCYFFQDHSTSQPFPSWVPPSSVQLDPISKPRFDFESANMGRGGGKFKVCFSFFSPSCPSGAHVTGMQTDTRSEKSRWRPWRAWRRQP